MSDDYEKKSAEHADPTPDHTVDPNVEKELVGPDSELHRGLKNRHAQMIS